MRNERFTNVVRFDSFELDLRSGELYSDGRKVQLQEQPFRILKLLTESAGELVTREEIRKRLWPNGTVVEFENAVNAAIKKLRIALGDSVDEPRYIETVKRRGYRLIVPVECQPVLPVQDLVGRKVSHYRVLDLIGGGGMGVVYRAQDTRLGREVALKFLPDELSSHPIALERLRSEARSASALNHPNICTIYEIEEHAGQPFIVMELLEGSTLNDRISAHSLSNGDVLDYAFQVTDGLNAAHRKGIIHRDIKPANIFITRDGQAKILDFGLAQTIVPREDAGQCATGPGAAVGTIAYMSPEQVLGKGLDARTDLFSLGVVLYEMATGKTPFSGDTDGAIFDGILHKTPDSPAGIRPDVPARLDRIVTKCLEKDRDLRYQDALEVRADLQRLQREATTSIARRSKILVLAAAAVVVSFIAAYFYFHRAPGLTDKDTIVLADFANSTGDTVFDGTLRQGLAVQLEQSPFLSLVSEERIQQTLRLMAHPTDTRLTPSLAREVCERTGSAAVLEGSIASLGSQYVLGLRAKNCRTGDVLDEQQVQAARKEDVLNALSQVASKFRARAGESLAMVEKHDTPLAEATTPSLEALEAYSTGWKILSSIGAAAALPLFKRAVEIDPKFAMAHGFLGRIYGDLGESALSAESSRQAWKLRDRASDREKFWITATYETQVTGNLEQARQTCELWARTYPRDAAPHNLLPGMIYPVFGKYEMAVEEARKAIELDPDFAISYNILALTYQILGRLEEAEVVLQRASKRELQIPEFLVDRYGIDFLKGDRAAMQREAALGAEKSGAEDWISYQEALALAYTGRLKQARTKSQHAADLAQHAAQRERAGLWATGPAVWEALFGNVLGARRSASAALAFSSGRDVKYGAVLALAISGDSALSRTLADDLEANFPEDTAVRFSYLPVIRARLALSHGEPRKAIELLQAAAPYELGAPPSSFMGFFGALYPVYVRGEALLRAKRGSEAAAEFQKILDHRGIVVSDPIGALAHLQLGRAFNLAGDKNQAKHAYNDFLILWKDADPDIPILKEAKAENAALQ